MKTLHTHLSPGHLTAASLPGSTSGNRRPTFSPPSTWRLAPLLVYLDPRSLIAFLLFLASAWFIYSLHTRTRLTSWSWGWCWRWSLIPVIGVRNIFYLEVIFQICVFAALALGLNIVVGFAGLLNLGYVAFYAVGAYLWAFFGSQQLYLLQRSPARPRPTRPSSCPPDAFYLFLFLGMGLAALVGHPAGPAGAARARRLPGHRHPGLWRGDPRAGQQPGQTAQPDQRPAGHHPHPAAHPAAPLLDSVSTRSSTPLVGHTAQRRRFLQPVLLPDGPAGDHHGDLHRAPPGQLEDRPGLDRHPRGRDWPPSPWASRWCAYKLAAFAVGASFAGVMGVLFAASRTFVSPESFTFMQSIGVLSMVILGGLGSIPGVIVGAAVVIILNLQVLQGLSLYLNSLRQSDAVIPIINFAWKNLSSQLDPAKYQRMLFGLILILMMIYRPAGLIPAAPQDARQRGSETADQTGVDRRQTEVKHGAA